jgi:hypothetical protein
MNAIILESRSRRQQRGELGDNRAAQLVATMLARYIQPHAMNKAVVLADRYRRKSLRTLHLAGRDQSLSVLQEFSKCCITSPRSSNLADLPMI